MELAAVESPRLVEVALDSVLFKRLTTFERVRKYVRDIRKPGLNGSGVLARLVAERDPAQAPATSFFETNFYRFLRNVHQKTLEFQYAVTDEHGIVARLDAAFPEKRIGIEAHSVRWHSTRQQVQRDADRHNRLAAMGWRILYETYENLNRRPHEILERLDRLLAT